MQTHRPQGTGFQPSTAGTPKSEQEQGVPVSRSTCGAAQEGTVVTSDLGTTGHTPQAEAACDL